MNTYEFDDDFLNDIKEKIKKIKNPNLKQRKKEILIHEINELIEGANDWIDVEQTMLEEEQDELNLLKESLNEEIKEFKKITDSYRCNNTVDMFE